MVHNKNQNCRFGFLVLFLGFFLLFSSCEDVVQVDVDSIEPRLVVEADIEWEKGGDPSFQTILLSKSTPFFEGSFVPADDAEVVVEKLDSGDIMRFTSVGNGLYENNNFIAELGAEYELRILFEEKEFIARESFIGVSDVDRVEQGTVLGFDGEDIIAIDFFTNDVPDEANFFFVTHGVNNDPTPFLSVWDDSFQDGNEITIFYREFFDDAQETIVAGDVIDIEFMGISQPFFDFMLLLTEQIYSGGDPFDTTPVQLRGNVANLTLPDEDAFGYFRLSEKVTFQVTVE